MLEGLAGFMLSCWSLLWLRVLSSRFLLSSCSLSLFLNSLSIAPDLSSSAIWVVPGKAVSVPLDLLWRLFLVRRLHLLVGRLDVLSSYFFITSDCLTGEVLLKTGFWKQAGSLPWLDLFILL